MMGRQGFPERPGSSIVSSIWQRVAGGVWCVEDVDGLPVALVTRLDDGPSLAVAEQWWSYLEGLIEWASCDAAREVFDTHWDLGDEAEQ